MNNVFLKGYIKDIEPSHTIKDVEFYKAKILTKRDNGSEDVVDIKFKRFCNKYKENDLVFLKGNVRSYSYKLDNGKNKVNLYVFTYFDIPEEDYDNRVELTGRICKLESLRYTKSRKRNIHFIVANNIVSKDSDKRLNSYIPCIAWGDVATKISKLSVSTPVKLIGELHSREHKVLQDNGEYVINVAHELFIKSFEVIDEQDI